MEKVLNQIYTDLQNPNSFSSIKKLYEAGKKHLPNLTLEQVKEFLTKKPAYGIYRKVVRKFPRIKIIETGLHSGWSADLLWLKNLSRFNQKYKYLLTIIDTHSRFCFLEPVLSKSTPHVIEAFENVFKRSPTLPIRIVSDEGNEFASKRMHTYFKSKNIDKLEAFTQPLVKASLAERLNRTIREKLRRYFYEYKTWKWIDIIQDLAHNLNSNKHSTIKIRPIDVTSQNSDRLWRQLYAKDSRKQKKPKFEEGQLIRLSLDRLPFTKDQRNFSQQLYRIHKVFKHKNPIVYTIRDLTNEITKGYIYEPEILAISDQFAFQIERVLQRRRKNGKMQFYVKWKNLGNDHNAWIHQNELV